MKTIIASALVALSFAAPAAAETSSAQAFFALSNDSAAERLVRGGDSGGDPVLAQEIGALANESAAERQIIKQSSVPTRNAAAVSFFAMGNDSPAEN